MAQTLDHETKAHSSKGFSISFNATGDKMVTSREDLSIKVWGPEGKLSGDSGREYVSWAHIYTLRGHHERPIFSVHWSSEGIIASGAADGAIRLFVENQDGLPQERGRDMFKLLMVKEKAHEVDIMQWGSKSQATGEAKFEMQMTKKRAHEMDGNFALQVPKLQERQNDMLKHLVPNEKVSAVHWGPKGINLLASSSDKGTIKIWELTTLQ
nr:PREDICTED: protein CIA1-like [Daucus carota subsp. sativus]